MQRKYDSDAERQRAHRQRVKERLAGLLPIAPKMKAVKKTSRPQRIIQVEAAIQALAEEYQDWFDRLPENFQNSDQGVQLEQTVDQLQQILDILAELEVPHGFGR